MRRLDAGTTEKRSSSPDHRWQNLELRSPWPSVLGILNPGPAPRPIQAKALAEYQVLDSRRNLIISSPTNSGKSLAGLLVLLEAVYRRRRAVLLEPLRAIAREKVEELESVAAELGEVLGRHLTIRISTGDYRLEHEEFTAPPPEHGELVVVTPERFDAVLRNPDYDDWVSSVGAICVDEAHLIGSPHRGSTLEYLITYMLCLPAPPRIVLLSATLGDTDEAQEWLSPCDVISVAERYPPLHKQVLELESDEDANEAVATFARDTLADPAAHLLIFVYQTRSTQHLARLLEERLGEVAGSDGPLAYHAQMSAEQRLAARTSFCEGHSRCLITTTALGLGVNLPATHVLVRDTIFAGVGPLDVADLLQMMGRAGRGDQPGHAAAIVRANDTWDAEELADALRAEALPSLTSHFDRAASLPSWRQEVADDDIILVAKHVASQLARRPDDGLSLEQLQGFFERSLGGKALTAHVPNALTWLTDPMRVLAYQDEHGKYRPTVLGQQATRAVLPLDLAAGFAQLVRDLLTIDPSDRLLEQWQPLDHLVVLDLLYDRTPNLRRFSKALVGQVDGWMEASPGRTPLLFREWIAGQQGASRAEEVLGSLGVSPPDGRRDAGEWARQRAYLGVFRSIILYERGLGTRIEDLQRRWRVKNLVGVEERWRDDMLWLLSGLAKILDLRCFYYHLREECDADPERVRGVKKRLRRMRLQTYDLQEQLKYCSPLGPVLRSIRSTMGGAGGATVGVGTIHKLEDAGIQSLTELIGLQVDDLVRMGIRRDLARQIYVYVRRRLQ